MNPAFIHWRIGRTVAPLLAIFIPAAAHAGDGPIQDNSFLVEEAYNQEAGVIQHISTFSRSLGSGAWTYTFTEEWPLADPRHQVSATVPLQGVASAHGPAGLGDVALHYRLQVVGNGEAPVACAPRATLLLPTGDAARGLGLGGVGFQVALPLSGVLGPSFVSHTNLGATFVPGSSGPAGRGSTAGFNAGQSVVWLAAPRLNLLLEAVYSDLETTTPGGTSRVRSLYLDPGLRAALDLPGGAQAVAGVGVPIGLGPSRGDVGLFLYLSFEHPAGI